MRKVQEGLQFLIEHASEQYGCRLEHVPVAPDDPNFQREGNAPLTPRQNILEKIVHLQTIRTQPERDCLILSQKIRELFDSYRNSHQEPPPKIWSERALDYCQGVMQAVPQIGFLMDWGVRKYQQLGGDVPTLARQLFPDSEVDRQQFVVAVLARPDLERIWEQTKSRLAADQKEERDG